MKYLIAAVLSLSTVLAIPSHYPYPIHPGVGAIYKGPNEETIIKGPDGSVITAESDSAGSIKVDSPPRIVDSAPAVVNTANHLSNTGPNLFNSGNDELRARAGFANAGSPYVDTAVGLANAGDGLAHSGQAFVNTVGGFAHSGPAFVNTVDGLAHSGPAFVNIGEGLAHSEQAFVNAEDALAHSRQALLDTKNAIAHSAQAFGNTVDGLAQAALAHSRQAFEHSAYSGQAFVNTGEGLLHSGAALENSEGGFVQSGGIVDSGDGLIHTGNIGRGFVQTDPELVPLVHSAPVLVNQAPVVGSFDNVAPAVINAVAPVILNENPIVVPDVVEHDHKIVKEHVIVGNKVISVPKLVEADSDLIGPSGTISTRGGDTVISGPASITIKGDGVITEIDKQPDVLIKTVEVKPVVAPVVIKPVAPIATIQHTVVSNPIISEARPVLAPTRTVYAESAPVLGINPIVRTKVIEGFNPILSHRPAIIKSGPILTDSVATSFAEHNAVFGSPHYAPEFLPLNPFSFKPIYGPLH